MIRIPIAVNLESRDGTLSKDAKAVNCIVEMNGNKKKVRKRPGLSDFGLVKTGVAQLLVYWNGIKAIIGDFFCSVSASISSQSTCVWNSADKDVDITLSGGDLTAANTSLGNSGSVRGTIGISSGTMYFEVTLSAGNPSSFYVGVANTTFPVTLNCGQDLNSVARFSNQILSGGLSIASVTQAVATDVVGVVVDATARTVSFYLNGTFQYQAIGAAVPSGTLYPCIGLEKVALNVSTVTNFGATAFTYTPTNVISTNLSPTSPGLFFSAQDNGSNAGTDYLMFKNATQAWTLKPSGTPTLITDVDYPGISTVNVTQITRSGSTVTVQTASDTNFQVGSAVTIAGANEADYNGVKTVTAVTASNVRDSTEIPITITRSGTTATATSTTQPHGFINGQVVPIKGADQAEYNGDKTITWISATQFSFTVTVTGTDLSSPAGGSPALFAYPLKILLINTGSNSWAGSYINPYDYGYLQNGDTFTGSFGLGTCTVSSPGESTFFITSTSSTHPLNTTLNLTVFKTQPTISSIASSYNICTVTTSAAHNFRTGRPVSIGGATPAQYNVTDAPIEVTGTTTFRYTIPNAFLSTPVSPATGTILAGDPAVITGPSFTYSIATTPSTPATGTITATGGRNTVPGIVYINGYFVVMDVAGVLYNSAIDDPTTWNALEFTAASNESGGGVALAKSLNYVVAFKEWSTEFFYDAKNPTGSPLSPVENGFTLIGCASGTSIANVNGMIVWLAQVRERGRSIYAMSGIQQSVISTPDVDRILNADSLTTVHAYGLKVDGHPLYVLTLVGSDVTLVYDMSTKHWFTWSSYTLGSSKSVSSITRSGTTATVTTGVAHTLNDGDPVLIAGANQAGYNGIFQAAVLTSTTFTIEVDSATVTPATGTITATPYTESYFKFTKYADCAGDNLVLHESDGHLYEIDSTLYRDAGIPINYLIRSTRIDGGTSRKKAMGRITLIGDVVSDIAMIRWSDDDYVSNRPYRVVDLDEPKAMVRRCGAFVDRSVEVKHVGNTRPIWDAIELEIQ